MIFTAFSAGGGVVGVVGVGGEAMGGGRCGWALSAIREEEEHRLLLSSLSLSLSFVFLSL